MTRPFRTLALALVCAAPLAAPAAAQERLGPPASYTAQHWVDPQTNCSYTRAKAPGYAPTWHLIFNGAHVGLTDAHSRCPMMLRSS